MAKKGLYGVNNYRGETRKKRPGRHKKRLNKSEKRQKKRGWQSSYINLYIQDERNKQKEGNNATSNN